MGKTPKNFQKTVLFLAKILKGRQYAFRGTAGLVLQGLDMNVDDIDIVCDMDTAEASNELLADFVTEPVSFKETSKLKSYFGKFKINNILVEVYGDWQIKDLKGNWGEAFDASDDEVNEIEFQGRRVRVVKPGTELSVFAKLGRWNAFHKIKKQVELKKNKSRQTTLF